MASPWMKRILVVDDLADNLFLLQTLLETEGYRVETANDGRSALAKLQTTPPDLVLLDVMMPGMNGFEVTQQIRQHQQLSSLPILLITAHSEAKAEEGLSVGADDFITKPIDFDDLMQRVQKFLNSDSPAQDRVLSSQFA
jgi:CheY-like chemotaxis protein